MRKVNCIIADDEALARNIIKNHVGRLERLQVIATCTNGLEVYAAIKATNADLLFLDIQMPQLTGIELLRTVKNPPAVIITTAYGEFALEGYELNVIDYLLKPIPFERFLKAIDKYETWVNPGHLPQPMPQPFAVSQGDPFIYVKSEKKMVRILLRDILYIEGLKDYVKIHMPEKQIVTYQTLSYFEEKLPAGQFMRVHRSYIVALGSIVSFSAAELSIGNTALPIGSTYSKEVAKRLNLSA
jgi:DNA-binding LytR/AlgR family response regulator